jgi:endonuclease G
LGGNSGSALVDLNNGNVVGLHFGGRYQVINFGVPAAELSRDQRVVDAGVIFAGTPAGGEPFWFSWWKHADAMEPEVLSAQDSAAPAIYDSSRAEPSSGSAIDLVVPLHITIRLGQPTVSPSVAARIDADGSAGIERLAVPWHDTDYASREGYDPEFLDIEVSMPEAADPSVVAKPHDGRTVLHYQHFSIIMHAKRRLALITASNVTAEARSKRPESGYAYNRKGLSGLGPSDQERWFPDPRLDGEYQLPDVFYNKDGGAFDKGHIVRRDDVAWGQSHEL